MKFKPTQKQLHAQAKENFGLFETTRELTIRIHTARTIAKQEKQIAPAQNRVTLSETREWYTVKDIAANTGNYRVAGWEGMNFSACATFGAEASTLRNVVRCDVDGVCL